MSLCKKTLEVFRWCDTAIRVFINVRLGNAQNLAPLSKASGFSTKLYQPVVSAIPLLRLPFCPATVFGAVVAVAINPVNCVLEARALSHVGKEIYKPVAATPPVADCDTPRSIVGKVAIASHQHRTVSLIHRGSCLAVLFSRAFRAAATYDFPDSHVLSANHAKVATDALAIPKHLQATIEAAPARRSFRENCQFAEYIANQILAAPDIVVVTTHPCNS
jgi:hypothetical protein